MEENLGDERGNPGEAPDPALDADVEQTWRSFERAAPPFEFIPPRRRRRLLPVSIGIAVVAAAAVGAVVATGGSSKSGSGLAPADFVLTATQTTLGQRTADLIFAGTVTASGHAVPISGTGQAVLSDPQQYAAKISISAPDGTALQEKEIASSGDFYLGISSGAQDVSSLVPGKHWVQIPLPIGGNSSLGTGTSDPLTQLEMAAAKGNTVTSVGTETIRGITTSGYAVTISRANLLKSEQSYLSSSGLDPATKQQISQAVQSFPTPTIYVWFDSSKLLRRMGFTTNQTQNGKNLAVNLEMDYVNYGAPVSISTPSSSDVVPLSQFLAAAKAATGNG